MYKHRVGVVELCIAMYYFVARTINDPPTPPDYLTFVLHINWCKVFLFFEFWCVLMNFQFVCVGVYLWQSVFVFYLSV